MASGRIKAPLVVLRRALWPARGAMCQSCGHGSLTCLQFWVVESQIHEGRLLCLGCAAIALAEISKGGMTYEVRETTLLELEAELAVNLG